MINNYINIITFIVIFIGGLSTIFLIIKIIKQIQILMDEDSIQKKKKTAAESIEDIGDTMPLFEDDAEIERSFAHMVFMSENGADSNRIEHLSDSTTKIGRRSDMNIRLEDGAVSSVHATIIHKHNKMYIKDLGSKNGIILNGKKVPEHRKTRIYENDVIKMGHTCFSVKNNLSQSIS